MVYNENDIIAWMKRDEERTTASGKKYNRNLSYKKAVQSLERADKSTRIDLEDYYKQHTQIYEFDEDGNRWFNEQAYTDELNRLTSKRIKQMFPDVAEQIIEALRLNMEEGLSRKVSAEAVGLNRATFFRYLDKMRKDNYLRCLEGNLLGDGSFKFIPPKKKKAEISEVFEQKTLNLVIDKARLV